MNDLIPVSIRRRLYPIALAVSLLAVGYGLITEEQAGLWLGLVTALVGTGTATAHRPVEEYEA